MSDTNEWFNVTDFLYSGISKRMEFYRDFPKYVTPKKMEELEEAIKIYCDRCVVSGKFLRDDFQSLCQSVQQETVEDEYDLEI